MTATKENSPSSRDYSITRTRGVSNLNASREFIYTSSDARLHNQSDELQWDLESMAFKVTAQMLRKRASSALSLSLIEQSIAQTQNFVQITGPCRSHFVFTTLNAGRYATNWQRAYTSMAMVEVNSPCLPSLPSRCQKHHAFVSRHANNIPRDEQKKSKTQLPKHLRHKSHPSNHPAKSPAANAAHSHSG
jgi:hypothetical protein